MISSAQARAALGLLLLTGCGGGRPEPERAAPPSALPTVTAVVVAAPDGPPKVPGRERDPNAIPSLVGPNGECDPMVGQRSRREGDLTVAVPPARSSRGFLGRLRSHSDGALSRGSARVWVGPAVPMFVPLHQGTTELTLLDPVKDGFFAFYRDPYGSGSCDTGGALNCRFVAALFDRCGKQLWSQPLNNALSRSDQLEIQDARYDAGTLYFNEACQSYSRDAGGRCSSLVALDPATGKVKWRTAPLVSNNRILLTSELVVAGYGFTAEADSIALVRRSDGKVVHKQPLPSAHEDLALEGESTVVVTIYPGDKQLRFDLVGQGDKARLVRKN